MTNQNDFSYTYAATPKEQLEAAQRIRRQYVRPEEDNFDRLKALDEKVKRPGTIASFVLGILGSLILGTGMCLVLVWFQMAAGIVVGCLGIALIGLAYPVYGRITNRRKQEYAPQIIKLTEALENN